MTTNRLRNPVLGFLLCLGLGGGLFGTEVLVKPEVFYPGATLSYFPVKDEPKGLAETPPSASNPTSGLLKESLQDTPTAPPPRSMEEHFLLQIFLDEVHFGPGVIDGKIGSFTKTAAQSYYRSIGQSSPSLDLAYRHAFAHNSVPFVTVQVPSLAANYIDERLPYKYREMATRDKSQYRSTLEFMTERYHTSQKALARLNKASTLRRLKIGDTLVVPNVRPFLIEEMEFVRFSSHESINRNRVVIDTKKNRLSIYRPDEFKVDVPASSTVATKEFEVQVEASEPAERLIASFPITPGRKDQIRYGKWKVKNSVTFPNWRYDPLVLKGLGRSKNSEVVHVPPGPNNPVGVLWCGLTARSVGIHGTNTPETIGRTTSSGCIRMANWDVIKIPNFIRPGVEVTIK